MVSLETPVCEFDLPAPDFGVQSKYQERFLVTAVLLKGLADFFFHLLDILFARLYKDLFSSSFSGFSFILSNGEAQEIETLVNMPNGSFLW